MLVIEVIQKVFLERLPFIQYLVYFWKDKDHIQALLNLGSKVNIINSAYIKKLRLCVRRTDMGAQKIDKSYLNTFRIVITGFSFQDKLEKV